MFGERRKKMWKKSFGVLCFWVTFFYSKEKQYGDFFFYIYVTFTAVTIITTVTSVTSVPTVPTVTTVTPIT